MIMTICLLIYCRPQGLVLCRLLQILEALRLEKSGSRANSTNGMVHKMHVLTTPGWLSHALGNNIVLIPNNERAFCLSSRISRACLRPRAQLDETSGESIVVTAH